MRPDFNFLRQQLAQTSTAAIERIGISIDPEGHAVDLLAGVYLALEAHRRRTGRTISAIWLDDRRSAEGAVLAARAYLELGVRYVIGHFSATAALAAADIYDANDVVFMAPGTSHPDLTAGQYRSVFRLCGRDDDQALAMLSIMPQSQEPSSLLVLAQDIRYGRSLSGYIDEECRRRGRAAVVMVGPDAEVLAQSGTTWCEGRKTENDAAVLVVGTHEFSADVVRCLRHNGVFAPICVSDDALTPRFPALLGDLAEGLLVTGLAGHPGSAAERSGPEQECLRLLGEQPGAYFLTSYAAAAILAELIDRQPPLNAGACPGELRSRPWHTCLGKLSFREGGEVTGIRWTLQQISGGRFTPLTP